MLLQDKEKLEEKIVGLLAKAPYLTARQIHQTLNTDSRSYSPQAVFKELKKLQEASVLMKVQQSYGLNLSWASELIQLGETIEDAYYSKEALARFIPQAGKKVTWYFSDLRRMKNLWSQLVLVLVAQSPSKILYSWNPHPWFYLAQATHQQQLMKALRAQNAKQFKIVGGDTYLDRLAAKFWDKKFVNYSFAEGPFEKQRSTYFSIADEFMVLVTLTKSMARRIDQFYDCTASAKDLDIAALIHLLEVKTQIKVTLLNDQRKTARCRKKFEQFFG